MADTIFLEDIDFRIMAKGFWFFQFGHAKLIKKIRKIIKFLSESYRNF